MDGRMDLQSIMSGLLASAAGKQEPCTPVMSKHTHSDSFIIPGEYRQESASLSSEKENHTVTEPNIQLRSPSEENLPSYVPCYGFNGYSSPPSYIRGDFYHLSPPESAAPVERSDNKRAKPARSFTIDSLISSENCHMQRTSKDEPAMVYSALTTTATDCSFGQFRFSMTDWSVFQSAARTQTSVSAVKKTVYWCHVCETFCPTAESASRHQIGHCSKGDNCKLLRKFFKATGYVSIHEESDYLNRIRCGLCEKIVTNCFFSKHIRRHEGHVCYVCGHECTSNSRLMSHMNGHTGLTPFTCKFCDRKFGDRRQLAKHEYVHKKSFNDCKFCGKTFTSKYSRIVHERIHTGNNPFTCTFPGCERSFPQKVQLKLHQSSHR